MKRFLVAIPVLALVALFAPVLSVSAQVDPGSVLQQFVDARNLADEGAAMALVAPDMMYIDGAACPPASPCIGTEAMRRDVQVFISDHTYSYSVGNSDASSATVHVRLASQSPNRGAIGVEQTLSDVTVEVRDGQLISWTSVNDATDPQTAWWLSHQPAR